MKNNRDACLQRWMMAGLCLGLMSLFFGCVSREKTESANKRENNAAAFDKGGFSVDFRTTRKTPVMGPDYLMPSDPAKTKSSGTLKGWEKGSYVWLPVADKEAETRIQKRVEPLMKWDADPENPCGTNQRLHIAIPESAFNSQDPEGHETCAFYHKKIIMSPSPDNVKYVFSFRYCGSFQPNISNSRAYVQAMFYDNEDPDNGKETRVYALTVLLPISRWRDGEFQFIVPKNTKCLDVRLAVTRCGQVWFKDLALQKALKQEKGPTVVLMPGFFLDNTYCLSSGDVGMMVFGFLNESKAKLDKPCLLLRLPEGIDVLGLNRMANIVNKMPGSSDKAGLTEYRIDISAWKERIHDGTFRYPYNMWQGLALMLKSSLPPGDACYKAQYWLEDGQYQSEPLSFDIKILPAIPETKGPTLFKTGAVLFLVDDEFSPEPESCAGAWAGLYKRVGFNSALVSISSLGKEFGKLGIERYNQPFANGYSMGDNKMPEEAMFRLRDGKPLEMAICPVEVYTKGPYYRSRIENDILRRILVVDRQAEQIMANWEPDVYKGKGCFCNRCKAEFQKFSGLPTETVERVWLTNAGCDYADVWVKFRSWQHGQLMATVESSVNKIGKEAGLESHFIPEITYSLLTPAGEKSKCEYLAADYLEKLPVLVPFAPYNCYIFTDGPWDYVRGLHLNIYASSLAVRDYVASRLPPDRQTRLIAFPYGTYESATQPEALAFEFITYFLNRYNGAFAYLFPGGYDARYYHALAGANRTIACFETWVFQGSAVQKHTLTCETPLPKPDPRFLLDCTKWLNNIERLKDLPLLLSWEYEKDGTRLIAVGNFWERGECFFRLTPKELKVGAKYVLREPEAGRCYADKAGNLAFTVNELSKGILLHVGAMRYAFFILEPYQEGLNYGTIIRQGDMEKILSKRRSCIDKMYQKETHIESIHINQITKP